ncbi:glutamate mutase L, partial [Micromonospora rosaria]
ESAAVGVLGGVLADHAGGWAVPRAARAVVDVDYVLAAGGLLAAEHPGAARALLGGRFVTE